MAPDVAEALARLGDASDWVGDDDLVFVGDAGGYLDGSALRRRYKAALARAGLRPLRFHDLRHTFGTRMIAKADIRRVQEWMGHADIQTTMRYLHYAPAARTPSSSRRRFASSRKPLHPRRRSLYGFASRRSPVRSRLAPSTKTEQIGDISWLVSALPDRVSPHVLPTSCLPPLSVAVGPIVCSPVSCVALPFFNKGSTVQPRPGEPG